MTMRFKFAFGDLIYEFENYNLNMPVNLFLNDIKNRLKIDFALDDSTIIQIIPMITYPTNIPTDLNQPITLSDVSLFTYLVNNDAIDNIGASFYVRLIYVISGQMYHFTIRYNNKYYISNEELEQVKNGNLNIKEICFIPEQELVIEQQSVIEQNEYCSVCYTINIDTILSRNYNCQHIICNDCFLSWHNTSHFTCPECRQCEL